MKTNQAVRVFSVIIVGAMIVGLAWVTGLAQVSQNPVQAENARPGTKAWQIQKAASGPGQIEGYASAPSINRGDQITFFVNTTDPSYTLQVFRIGYYQGLGGRAETAPITLTGMTQTVPAPDPVTGIVDCNWTPAYTLVTNNPNDATDWVSGVYVALLTGFNSGLQSYIPFIVRDDSRTSDLLFQSSVNTSQAYNAWGGKSLYISNSTQGVAAVEVSFNRPYDDGWGTGLFMSYEWNMMAYLEQQGYDVTYTTDVDTHTSPAQLLQHKVFLSVGHNEYWSWEMRQNVTAALNAGIDLAFFGANDAYWQIRYQASPATGQANRVLVCYKTLADAEDPMAANPATYYLITDLWRNFKITFPGMPESLLIGEMYNGQEPMNVPMVITNASNWVFNGTGLSNGSQLRGLQGYEADQIYPSGISPSNVIQLAQSPYVINGTTYNANMSLYQASSGAWVFATGSMYFQYGLSSLSPWAPGPPSLVSAAAQQITQNVLNAFIAGTVPGGQPTSGGGGTPTPTPTGPIMLRGITVSGTSVTGGSSVTVNVPSGVQPGDVLVAQLGVRGNGPISAPAGWSLVRKDTAGTTVQQAVYTHVVPYWPAEPASYTWTFNAGNNAGGGIADYVGVNNASPVDANGGQSSANSIYMVAPSVSVPTADNSDQQINLYTIANSAGFVLSNGTNPEYGYIPGGISIGMSDLPLFFGGPTSSETATAYAPAANLGAEVALLPGPPAPQPAIFLRSVGTGSNSTASPSVTINVPAGSQAGDLMIAQIAVRGGSGQSISPPAGWLLVRSDFSGTSILQATYSHTVSSSPEPSTYTWTFKGSNNAAGGIADLFGATGVDVSNGLGNTSSTSITAPGVVIPSNSNDHLLCLFSTAGGVAPVTPVGTTSQWSFRAVSFGIGVAMSDIASVSAGTTQTEIATTSTAYANVGVQLALH